MKACPYCAEQVQDAAIRCRWCGSDLTAPVPAKPGRDETTAATLAPGRPTGLTGLLASAGASVSSGAAIRRWWGRPLLAALGAVVAILVCGALLLVGTDLAADRTSGDRVRNDVTSTGAGTFARLLTWPAFILQRVPLVAGGDEGTLRGTFAPLTGLLVIGVLIAVAGGFAASRDNNLGQRLAAVARFAVPFALLFFIVSFPVTEHSGGVRAGPSHVGAVLLPLLWGLLFGCIGMARSTYGRNWWHRLGARLDNRLPGAGSAWDGALAGARAGLGLALLAVLVVQLAVASRVPPGTRPWVIGLWIIALLLVQPNLASATILAGMGATIRGSASLATFTASTSVGILGASGAATGRVHVPAYWLALLLVPLVAMVRAGYVAAGGSRDQRLAVRAALLAGGLLAIGCWLLAWLSGGYVTTSGSGFSLTVSPTPAIFLPVVWAVLGTSLGTLLCFARQHRQRYPGVAMRVDSCPCCGRGPDEGSRYCESCGTKLQTAG